MEKRAEKRPTESGRTYVPIIRALCRCNESIQADKIRLSANPRAPDLKREPLLLRHFLLDLVPRLLVQLVDSRADRAELGRGHAWAPVVSASIRGGERGEQGAHRTLP